MTFHWTGPNAIEDGEETGSMALSPVLKNHNAYLIHNETLYCDEEHGWRGDYSCLKVRLHFTRDKWFYYTTVFMPGTVSPFKYGQNARLLYCDDCDWEYQSNKLTLSRRNKSFFKGPERDDKHSL